MNVLLVDHLVCPRCGPPFGLVLLARDVRDRRIRRGEFGCANCRDSFPVEDGFGDLRPPPRGPGGGGGDGGEGGRGDSGAGVPGRAGAANRALRLAAAIGVTEGPGLIVVPDSLGGLAAALARLVRGIEVVVTGWGGRGLAGGGGTAGGGVSAFVTGPRLPLRDGAARGAVAEGDAGEEWWGECLRALMPGGRLVIAGGGAEAARWARREGLAVVVEEDGGMLAAARPLPGAEPRLGRWVGGADRADAPGGR